MLVLSRKVNETIVIDSGISIKVLKIRGTKVQLGIVAPQGVRIHRQEVMAALAAAAGATADDLAPPEKNGALA